MKFKHSGEAYAAIVDLASEQGKSQTDIAKQIGVTPQAINNAIRRGSVKLPILQDHALALGYKVELLISKTRNPKSKK